MASNTPAQANIPPTVSDPSTQPVQPAGDVPGHEGFFGKIARFVSMIDPAQREQARSQAISNLAELGSNPDPIYQQQYKTLLQDKKYLKANFIDKETAESIQAAVASKQAMMKGASMIGSMMSHADLRQPGTVESLLGRAMPFGTDVLNATEGAVRTSAGIAEKQIGEAGATQRQGMKDTTTVQATRMKSGVGEAIARINGQYRIQGDKIRASATVEAAKIAASSRGLGSGAKKNDWALKTYNKFVQSGNVMLKGTLGKINAAMGSDKAPSPDDATAAATQSNLDALAGALPFDASVLGGDDPANGARTLMSNMQNSLIYFSPGDNKAMTLADAKAQAAKNPNSPEAKAFYAYTNALVKKVVEQASGQIDANRDYMSGNSSAPIFIQDSGAESPEAPNPYAGDSGDGGSDGIEQPTN